jgi:aminoglycoside 6'-N-acetyltransferase
MPDLISLRPVIEADLTLLERAAQDPACQGPFHWFGFRPRGTLRARFAETGLLGPDGGELAVDVSGECAGSVSWRGVDYGPLGLSRCWNMGILLWPAFRGRGVGTEAQRQLVAYLFAHSHAERVEASTDMENLAEQRALSKVGFQREGVLRHAQFREGRWHDLVGYAILRGELGTGARKASTLG